jgi:hypothetical protein
MEIGCVLPGENRRGHCKRDLHPRKHNSRYCSQRYLGLAESHISADYPVHRMTRSEIV